MTTFDGWETQFSGDAMARPTGQLSNDELMHFRTRGSKNGVRRYQMPDGTWTPLGLKERKAREGWGESRRERKAAKQVAKSERKAAKAAAKSAKIAAKQQRAELRKSNKKKNDLSDLTDEELQKRINRVKMEQEYRELTKHPALKAGEKIFSRVMEYQAAKAANEENRAKRELDNNRVKADIIKAQEATKKSQAEAQNARYEYKKMKQDRKAGLEAERESKLLNSKIAYRATTIRGGIAKRINQKLSAGVSDKYKAKRTAEGKVLADLELAKGKEAEAKRQSDLQKQSQKEAARQAAKQKRKYDRKNRKFDKQYGLGGQLNY